MTLPPELAGFRQRTITSPFIHLVGPVYEKTDEDGKLVALALQIQEKHRNLRGVTHGGALMTFADSLLGDLIANSYDRQVGLVTVSFNSDFLRSPLPGDWVIGSGKVSRAGRTLAFAECVLRSNDRDIFRASGIFAVVRPKGLR